MDEQDTRQNRVEKSVVQSVYCVCYVFSYVYFDKQVHKKNWKKIKHTQKIKSLIFAESNMHRKTNEHGSFETCNLFFYSLTTTNINMYI